MPDSPCETPVSRLAEAGIEPSVGSKGDAYDTLADQATAVAA
jgi:hypothetical protein